MKKLLGLVLIMLLIAAALPQNESIQESSPIEGTWELVSHFNYDGVNVTDTVFAVDGYRQIKMYYNGKVMWTRYVPQDSVEWFGYGSYEMSDSTLTERLEYMSASMRKIANKDMEWNMELQFHGDTYSQIFIDDEGNRINSENYVRID